MPARLCAACASDPHWSSPSGGRRNSFHCNYIMQLSISVRQKLIFLDDGSNRHFAVGTPVLDPHHTTFALHADTFSERDLGWKGQCESYGCPLSDRGLYEKTDAARADIANLRSQSGVVMIDRNRYVKRK